MVYHLPSIITMFITAGEGSIDEQVKHCKCRLNLRPTIIYFVRTVKKKIMQIIYWDKTLTELKSCLRYWVPIYMNPIWPAYKLFTYI